MNLYQNLIFFGLSFAYPHAPCLFSHHNIAQTFSPAQHKQTYTRDFIPPRIRHWLNIKREKEKKKCQNEN